MTGTRRLGLALSSCWLAGCAALGVGTSVRGTLEAERALTLPAGAVARIEVVDIAEPQERRAIVASQTLENVETLPLRFDVRLDADVVNRKRPYEVRARITAGGVLLFVSEGTTPVLTGGHPRRVALRVVPVR
jgi:uncharacterized lipoprotein YbaY